jgi:hypothetical protein
MDGCYVDEEKVTPEPSTFYSGWITSNIVGPFLGGWCILSDREMVVVVVVVVYICLYKKNCCYVSVCVCFGARSRGVSILCTFMCVRKQRGSTVQMLSLISKYNVYI